MEFTLPTTKSEMYDTLKEIYNYYRINTASYRTAQREEFSLERMEVDTLTDSELKSMAETIVAPAITREKAKKKNELNEKIFTLTEKEEKIEEDYAEIYKKIEDEYDKIIDSIKEEASKKGLSYSSLITEKLYKAEKDKAESITVKQAEESAKTSEIEGKISALNSELEELDDYFDELLTQDTEAKFFELKDAQDKKINEALKYNNSQYEKEIRYNNANLLSDASLELKYLEIQTKGFSKEKLVELGYYSDVLRCVSGYYDTLTPVAAYSDMRNEYDLMTYLESFYQDVLYAYQMRASGH